jgi:ATP-dependent Clp protease ATP-binding subunit ClpA
MTDRFEHFGESARRILQGAVDEALRCHATEIGVEHFMLALIDQGTVRASFAPNTLNQTGLTNSLYRTRKGKVAGDAEQRVLTPDAKRVIELSVEEQEIDKSQFINDKHLLRGLIREGSIIPTLLKNMDTKEFILHVLRAKAASDRTAEALRRLEAAKGK